MNQEAHNKIVSFIWSIADDCLRDVYVRGKYRDVILPMVVLRRLDALLEETKEAVLEEVKFQKEVVGLTELDESALKDASGYVFYNISPWTLQKLYINTTNSIQELETNFLDYLNGFSPNVQEIIEKFNLKAQVRHMAKKDVLLDVLEKFTSEDINLTNREKIISDGKILPPLSNLGMGYVFEELIRRFNEENNEEAGEHFTPREVIKLMTHIIFKPIRDKIPPIVSVYDPACGSGGMLTESENFIKEGEIRANCDVLLYGKEINDETYAICKSDMMIKGDNPENIRNGSTLAVDEFSNLKFDFMLSNPPYGKSWKSDERYIKDGKEVIDPRFIVRLKNYWGKLEELPAVPRSSDGQLLFLMEMVDKLKPVANNKIGSKIASVHNGSSLFTGDAGSGESNIRRYIIENDLLEAIIQLPNNLFYNTGITTYIWILSNNKAENRKGKVQLIDASKSFRKLRKNLGSKNCELSPKHIDKIIEIYQDISEFESDELSSKIFKNSDFGYYKVNIERPKRLKAQFRDDLIETLRYDKSLSEPMKWAYKSFRDEVYKDISKFEKEILSWCEEEEIFLKPKQKKALFSQDIWDRYKNLVDIGYRLKDKIGDTLYIDFNQFKKEVDKALKELKIKVGANEKKRILEAVSWYDESAKRVIKKVHKFSDKKLEELLKHLKCREDELENFGYYSTGKKNEYIEYERESELRDSESIPLESNILDYFLKEVKPYVSEAWIDIDSVKIGYEISFNRYFYKHKPLRELDEVLADIIELEKSSRELINDILEGYNETL